MWLSNITGLVSCIISISVGVFGFKNRKILQILSQIILKRIKYIGLSPLRIMGNLAMIEYTYMGERYELFLPYKYNLLIPMTQKQISVTVNGTKRFLNLQPGIPSALNAADFQINHIGVYDKEDQNYQYVRSVNYFNYPYFSPTDGEV